jgi:1-acyl-sn-glycerol-3-phosphate acyltransferase
MAATADLVQGVAELVKSRVPAADLDERDPDYIRESLPRLWLLASLYFRAEVRGLGNVPEEGPVLLVGNHSGGNLTPDTGVFTLAFSTYFGVERAFYQLAHNLVLSMPGLSFLRKYGTVAASHENARKALRAGAAVLVYPAATTRSTARSGRAAGSTSAVARASCGSRSTRACRSCPSSRSAARRPRCSSPAASGSPRACGSTSCSGSRCCRSRSRCRGSSTSATWPATCRCRPRSPVEALPPIDLRREFGADPDLDEVYDHLVRQMQETLDALAAERRFPVIG